MSRCNLSAILFAAALLTLVSEASSADPVFYRSSVAVEGLDGLSPVESPSGFADLERCWSESSLSAFQAVPESSVRLHADRVSFPRNVVQRPWAARVSMSGNSRAMECMVGFASIA